MGGPLDWDTAAAAVGSLSGQIAQLHGELIATTARIIADGAWAGEGIRTVEHFLEYKTGLDRSTVRRLVKVANRAEELPEAMKLLHEGRLTLDQAVVLADHAPASHSVSVTEFAENATVSQLRRGLIGWFPRLGKSAQGSTEPDTLTFGRHADRFTLQYSTGDLLAGELIEQAIREAKDALFTDGQTTATLADGLAEDASRSLDAIGVPARKARYRVLVHLDTNGRAWLHKKGALPTHLVDRYSCDGTLTPVWETDGHPVAVGRSQQIVPDRTRALIEDRDKGCRFPGCRVTGFVENHHIRHWRDGGPTDPANLVSLCGYHHASHHRGGFTIQGDPSTITGLTFHHPPGNPFTTGPIQPGTQGEHRDPPRPPPRWRGPTGEILSTRWVHFNPNTA
jgi:hypothetical protein